MAHNTCDLHVHRGQEPVLPPAGHQSRAERCRRNRERQPAARHPRPTWSRNAARFDAINARNYNDLWFYSNPVFVTVASGA
ncbi:hypothetical protein ACU4GD_06260 [Cupriavidus basilensis]